MRIEDYQETLRGHRVLHLIGKGSKPATMPITVPVLRALEACRGDHQRARCRVPLRDAQILARHADPRITEYYDRARGNLDRHGVHFLTAYVAGV